MPLFLRNCISLLMCFLIGIVFTQCVNTNTSKINFNKNRWYQHQILELSYKSSVENVTRAIGIQLNYAYGMQIAQIPLTLQIISPSQKKIEIPFQVVLLDAYNDELGSCMGDYCDIEHTILPEFLFSETGVYSIKVSQKFRHEYIPNVFSVHLTIF